MSWSILPVELRRHIFAYLAISKRRPYQSPKDRRAERLRTTQSERGVQSQYAAVNNEWQRYFESINFGWLILDYDDVRDFNDIVAWCQRGYLVRLIWLRVQLPEYGCTKCFRAESMKDQRFNEARFTTALLELLHCLATFDDWHLGITLELSVHSPSDAKHHCQELKNTINDTMWDVAGGYSIGKPNDRVHGWRNGRRLGLKPGAYARHFGPPSGIGLDLEGPPSSSSARRCPTARVVRDLVIRLQFFRHLSIRRGLAPILQCLPRLRTLTYECRQGINSGRPMTGQKKRQQEHRLLLDTVLRNSLFLKKVVLYEQSNYTYSHSRSPVAPDPVAGRMLASNSSRLHEIYVSWMVDAKDFFHAFGPDPLSTADGQDPIRPRWPHLKRLFLTTTARSAQDWGFLIRAAAVAAKQMPRLEKMELWGDKTNRLYYSYEAEDRHCTLSVPQPVGRNLGEMTVLCWQEVALMRGDLFELKVKEISEFGDVDSPHNHTISWQSATYATLKQLQVEYSWRQVAGG